jgi:hypothetical protein
MMMEAIRYGIFVAFVLSGAATIAYLMLLVGIAIRNWWRNK